MVCNLDIIFESMLFTPLSCVSKIFVLCIIDCVFSGWNVLKEAVSKFMKFYT